MREHWIPETYLGSYSQMEWKTEEKWNATERLKPIKLASLGRFERPTYRLGGGCSIHLSYRDALVKVSTRLLEFLCELSTEY